MAYINLDLAFPRHPKTRRLVGLLGRGAEMLLIRLWCYCGEHHCETGALTGYSEQEIETIVEWWGAKGVAVDAMVKVGFLVKDEKGGYHVKDWLEHSGHLRMLKVRAKANAEKRWRKIQPEDSHDFDNQDATSIASSNASGTASSNAPSKPSIPSSSSTKKRTSKTFVKPTVEQVREYCLSRENSVDPQRFIDHYESKGWLIGKSPMKDWQAAVRTWERGAEDTQPIKKQKVWDPSTMVYNPNARY